jgi:hypothetical protein
MLSQISTPCKKICDDFSTFVGAEKYDANLCAGGLEFFDPPGAFFDTADRLLNQLGHLVILFPIKSLAGHFYRRYHRSHGLETNTFRFWEIESFAWNYKLVAKKRIAPFTGIIALKKYL